MMENAFLLPFWFHSWREGNCFLLSKAQLWVPGRRPRSSQIFSQYFFCRSHFISYVEAKAMGTPSQRCWGTSICSIPFWAFWQPWRPRNSGSDPASEKYTLYGFHPLILYSSSFSPMTLGLCIKPTSDSKLSFRHLTNCHSCFKKCHFFREAIPNPLD